MSKDKVLVVEDEEGIRKTLKIFLQSQGYEVVEASNGKEGLSLLNDDIYLAIVDIMMPIMDGISMVTILRKQFDLPVIFLTAKTEEIDKITGLNLGADDYVTKPFEPMELMARVNAHMRRYKRMLERIENHESQVCSDHLIKVGSLSLDPHTREVCVRNENIRLTKKEYEILELLMKSPGRIYSAEQIYESVWKQAAINTETIMVHVRKLREKIELNPKKPEYLKVVWGLGYKIEKM